VVKQRMGTNEEGSSKGVKKNSFLEARGGKEQRRKEVEDRNKKIFLGKM
jgi:hypothetical protein